MSKTDPLAGLTEEENALLSGCRLTLEQDTQPLPTTEKGVIADLTIDALESLAASRASEARKRELLEKHEWVEQVNGLKYCIECGREECYGHDENCALDAELEDGEPRKLPKKYGEGESDDSKPEI